MNRTMIKYVFRCVNSKESVQPIKSNAVCSVPLLYVNIAYRSRVFKKKQKLVLGGGLWGGGRGGEGNPANNIAVI